MSSNFSIVTSQSLCWRYAIHMMYLVFTIVTSSLVHILAQEGEAFREENFKHDLEADGDSKTMASSPAEKDDPLEGNFRIESEDDQPMNEDLEALAGVENNDSEDDQPMNDDDLEALAGVENEDNNEDDQPKNDDFLAWHFAYRVLWSRFHTGM